MDLEQDKWKNGLENDSDSLILDVRTCLLYTSPSPRD